MAMLVTLTNLPNFLSSFTVLEWFMVGMFLLMFFAVQLFLLQKGAGGRRWMPLVIAAAALPVLELAIFVIQQPAVIEGLSEEMCLSLFSLFFLLLYAAWMALFASLLALMINMILKKSRT